MSEARDTAVAKAAFPLGGQMDTSWPGVPSEGTKSQELAAA